jgi:hypothetical protein
MIKFELWGEKGEREYLKLFPNYIDPWMRDKMLSKMKHPELKGILIAKSWDDAARGMHELNGWPDYDTEAGKQKALEVTSR